MRSEKEVFREFGVLRAPDERKNGGNDGSAEELRESTRETKAVV